MSLRSQEIDWLVLQVSRLQAELEAAQLAKKTLEAELEEAQKSSACSLL